MYGVGTSGWVATSVWGSGDPLPTLATMALPGVIGWSFPTSKTLSTRGGLKLLEKGPPTTCPSKLLLCQRWWTSGSLACPSLRRGLKSSSKFFPATFSSPWPQPPHHLPPLHPAIPCFDKPPKHNVAVRVNKVEGQLGGASPVGVGVGLPITPWGASERGSVRRGGSLEMKGGQMRTPGTIAE